MQPAYVPYLTLNDYLTTIRSDQLNNQLLDYIDNGGEFEKQDAESFAMDEARSILGSYFYLDFEFRPILPFNYNKKYYPGDRCIIDFPEWVAASSSNIVDEGNSATYSVGDCVIRQSVGFCCTKSNSDTEFNANNWIQIGRQFDIYFVNYPYDLFQLKPTSQIGLKTPGLYEVGSKVCWDKSLYLCRNGSAILSHQAKEQFYKIDDFPSPNMFPNQPSNQYNDGNRQWINKGLFFLRNIYPSREHIDEDENEGIDAWSAQYRKNWTFGDNRNSTMKQILIAIVIAKLMSRNSFQLEERSRNRDWAYRKLEKIRNGEHTTLIPILQPEQVGNISWGGSPKIINTF